VLITYQADFRHELGDREGHLAGHPTLRIWNNGKIVTLTLSAPAGSDNVDPCATVTDSFRWSA